MDQDNVTLRNKRIRHNLSVQSLHSDIDSSFQSSNSINRSLPDFSSTDTKEQFMEEIKLLKLELESAHNEIEALLLENATLQKKIIEMEQKTKHLLAIMSTPKTNNKKTRSLRKNNNLKKLKLNFVDTDGIANSTLNQEGKKPDHSNDRTATNKNVNISNIVNTPKDMATQNVSKIWFYGDQKFIGVASRLQEIRQKNSIYNYNISSITKPFAHTEEILKGSCDNVLGVNDKIVISVGENDTNPWNVISELHYVLKKNCNNLVFVIEALNNPHLNTVKLNQHIKLICNQFKNCKFIEINQYRRNSMDILYYLTNRLNFIINSIDYDTKFIRNRHQMQKNIPAPHDTFKQPHKINVYKFKKGTIDYYFQNHNKKKTIVECTQAAKKGTIPFYFPKIVSNAEVPLEIKNKKYESPTFFRH